MSDVPPVVPIRRVVTGHDENGKSCVSFDGPAPMVRESAFQLGTNFTDMWVIDGFPADVETQSDPTVRPFQFEPPKVGAVMRVIQSTARRPDYDPELDTYVVPVQPAKMTEDGTWERGGQNVYTTRIHKSRTLDYGVMLSGKRTLILDDGEYDLEAGDIVIQIGSWHSWSNAEDDSLMAFVMLDALFEEEPSI